MHLLALVTDAYGGHGGIARFNRNWLGALAAMPEIQAVTVLPRFTTDAAEPTPPRLRQQPARGRTAYVAAALRHALFGPPVDAVLCGHLHLVPLAALARRLMAARGARPPLLLALHGIEAWQRPPRLAGLSEVDRVLAVSEVTRERFAAWSGFPLERIGIMRNCVDRNRFTPGPKPADLTARYGLEGATVILGFGRVARGLAEERKGYEEMIAAMPRILAARPEARYLLCGDGDDRPRLQRLAAERGLGDRVVFAGFVPEERKVDHFRLADCFVLCGESDGFGIVLLEAMACGVPVVASTRDGSREAVRDGQWGELADPRDHDALAAAVLRALDRPRGAPAGLEAFDLPRFERQTAAWMREALAGGARHAA